VLGGLMLKATILVIAKALIVGFFIRRFFT
jgi:hypothetical protein